jgi:hypothetical protein
MVNLFLGAVLGAALTLASQLLILIRVVPRVEARKRREDRWERTVRDFIELLMTSLTDRASEAHGVQELLSDLRVVQDEPGQDRDVIAKLRADHVWEVRKATRAFAELAFVRVDLLAREIVALVPAAVELIHLENIARKYWVSVAVVAEWNEDDTEEEIESRWDDEFQARTELISQARLLADLPHPPRVSLRRRWWRWSASARASVTNRLSWMGI